MFYWQSISNPDKPSVLIRFLAIVLVCNLLIPGLSMAANTKQTQQPYRVGVLYWSMNIPGQVAMRKGLEKRAELLNAQAIADQKPGIQLLPFVAGDGPAGIENQINQMHDLILAKPDLIIVQPTDNAALTLPLLAANKANIPVVAYDQYISDGTLASFLTSNNYQAGFLDGEYIASKFSTDQSINIVLVEYPHVSSTVERVNGFLDALKQQNQPFAILQSFEAVEPVGGRKAGKLILQKFPSHGSIDVVFSVNDGGGLAVVSMLQKAGRTEILHATVDGDPESEMNIENMNITVVDCAQFCWHLGAEAMQAAWLILSGNKVEPVILLPVFPITVETQELYKGWYGKAPTEFHKPWPSNNPVWHWELTTPDGTIITSGLQK